MSRLLSEYSASAGRWRSSERKYFSGLKLKLSDSSAGIDCISGIIYKRDFSFNQLSVIFFPSNRLDYADLFGRSIAALHHASLFGQEFSYSAPIIEPVERKIDFREMHAPVRKLMLRLHAADAEVLQNHTRRESELFPFPCREKSKSECGPKKPSINNRYSMFLIIIVADEVYSHSQTPITSLNMV